MSIRTTIALVVDRLLDLLPGNRNDATSLEGRARKTVEKTQARLAKAIDHETQVVGRVEQKAEALVRSAERTALFLANELERLDKAGLIKADDRFAQVITGLAAAGFHPAVQVEAVTGTEG